MCLHCSFFVSAIATLLFCASCSTTSAYPGPRVEFSPKPNALTHKRWEPGLGTQLQIRLFPDDDTLQPDTHPKHWKVHLVYSEKGDIIAAKEVRDDNVIALRVRRPLNNEWPDDGVNVVSHVLAPDAEPGRGRRNFFIGTTKLFDTPTGFIQWGDYRQHGTRWYWPIKE